MEENCLSSQDRHWIAPSQPEIAVEGAVEGGPLALPSVTLQHESAYGIPVLRCSGRMVCGPESDSLLEAIRNVLHSHPSLILDLQNITTIDARGVGTLLTLRALAHLKDGFISLTNVNERVGRVLRLTNLFDLFKIYDSEMLAAQA